MTRAAQAWPCGPGMLSCLGVKVSCPGVRGAAGPGKRQGVTVRWGPVGTSGHATVKSSIPNGTVLDQSGV